MQAGREGRELIPQLKPREMERDMTFHFDGYKFTMANHRTDRFGARSMQEGSWKWYRLFSKHKYLHSP